jgi:hypothetical protein
MSTLDVKGMVGGFKVNRLLNDQEKEHRFNIRQAASSKPHYDLSLTRLNSTFVECVDKWYAMRGWAAMGGAAIAMVMGYGLIGSLRDTFETFDAVAILISLGTLAVFSAGLYLFTRDAFTYTHYPIRFNRRNRQVYVFRRDGTVLKVGWEAICWTIYGHLIGSRDLFVVGHVMADDKKTIKETFALSTTDAGAPGEQNLKSLFEFFRRYMEEGPGPVLEALKPTPLIMLPGIDKERESWRFGWEVLTLNFNGMLLLQILLQVFIFPMSLFRWLVMRTSKIPQWPQWVEDECAIEPDDPWIRDGRHRARRKASQPA